MVVIGVIINTILDRIQSPKFVMMITLWLIVSAISAIVFFILWWIARKKQCAIQIKDKSRSLWNTIVFVKTNWLLNCKSTSLQVFARSLGIGFHCWTVSLIFYCLMFTFTIDAAALVSVFCSFPAIVGAIYVRLDSRYGDQWKYVAGVFNSMGSCPSDKIKDTGEEKTSDNTDSNAKDSFLLADIIRMDLWANDSFQGSLFNTIKEKINKGLKSTYPDAKQIAHRYLMQLVKLEHEKGFCEFEKEDLLKYICGSLRDEARKLRDSYSIETGQRLQPISIETNFSKPSSEQSSQSTGT